MYMQIKLLILCTALKISVSNQQKHHIKKKDYNQTNKQCQINNNSMSRKLFNTKRALDNDNLQFKSYNITINSSQSTMTAAISSSVKELSKKTIKT